MEEQNELLLSEALLKDKIYVIRGVQVMLDSDLAEIYGYTTKRLNEQVKNNIEKFDEEDLIFQLSNEEVKELSRSKFLTLNNDFLRSKISTPKQEHILESDSSRSKISTLKNETKSNRGSNIKYAPYVFTEQGVAMLSAVLHSETAIQVSIRIMDAFVQLRHYVSEQVLKTDDKAELAEIRRLLLLHIDHCDKKFSEQDRKIDKIIHVLNNLLEEPKSDRKIGFKVSEDK